MALTVDRAWKTGSAPEAPVDEDRAHARSIREPERAHDQAVDADDAEQGATPHVAEGVEALLEESRRRERSAAREALHDLLVEQRVHLAIGVGRQLPARLGPGLPGERELAAPVDAVGHARRADGGAAEAGERREDERDRQELSRGPVHVARV